MRRPTIAALAAFAATATALAATTAISAAPVRADGQCPKFAGPMWTHTNPMADPPQQRGATWKLTARGVPCSFAATWAKKLVKTPFKGEALTKFKVVPKGWTCIAGGGLTGGGKGTPGQCNQKSKMFFWAPALPS